MFGHQPWLPVDLAFSLPVREQQNKSHFQYVKNLKSHLEESYKTTMWSAANVAERNKTQFDKPVTTSTLDIGDQVLVRNIRIRGKHKLGDKWEQTVYVVVKQAGDLPVYTVRPESGNSPSRTLHLLLPCGFLFATKEGRDRTLIKTMKEQMILRMRKTLSLSTGLRTDQCQWTPHSLSGEMFR